MLSHQIDVHLTALGHIDWCRSILQARVYGFLQDAADRSKHPELRLSLRVSEVVVLYVYSLFVSKISISPSTP